MAMKHGRFAAFEVKKEGGTVTPLQRKWIDDIRNAGGVEDVVYGWDDVRDLINETT